MILHTILRSNTPQVTIGERAGCSLAGGNVAGLIRDAGSVPKEVRRGSLEIKDTGRRLLVACVGLQLLACSSWRVERAVPLQTFLERPRPALRVTTADGRRVVIYRPSLDSAQISGLAAPPRALRPTGDSVNLPISGIVRVETRRVSVARTSVAAVLGLVGATVLIAIATCENRSCIP